MKKITKITIAIFLILVIIMLLYLIIYQLTKPKIDCGNGVYETWERGIVDGPVYYYDSQNNLLAKCPSNGFGASDECINLNKQCRKYKK